METISLRCNNCGSNLDVNPRINYCTCSYCGSSLQIQHTGSTYYTEVLEQVQDNTEDILANSEQMLIEQRIARLDREWQAQQKKFAIKDKNGKVSMPSQSSAVLGTVGAIIFVVIFFVITIKSGNGVFMLMAIPVIGLAIWSAISSFDKADNYDDAKQKYYLKRQRLLNELQNY